MKMSREQYKALTTLIETMIDEKIEDAFGRDGSQEWQAKYEALMEFERLHVEGVED